MKTKPSTLHLAYNFSELVERSFYSSEHEEEMTVAEYFRMMMLHLWNEGEGFSGKRPFGNSNWDGIFERDLMRAGILPGKPVFDDLDVDDDEQEFVATVDSRKFVRLLIANM